MIWLGSLCRLRVGLRSQCRFVDRLRVRNQECLRPPGYAVAELWWPVVSAPGVWLVEQMPPKTEGWPAWTVPTPDATTEWTFPLPGIRWW